jgi:hypothetical protein
MYKRDNWSTPVNKYINNNETLFYSPIRIAKITKTTIASVGMSVKK